MEAVGFVELLSAPAAKRRWSDEAKGRIVAETLRPGTVVADVARVYGQIPPNFVPGHPIAGTENSVIRAATASGNRLVRAFSTERHLIMTARQGFTRLWKGFKIKDVIGINTAQNNQLASSIHHRMSSQNAPPGWVARCPAFLFTL